MRTDFENETYESANEALLSCHAYLLEMKERGAAIYLEGLDYICDQVTARVAHTRLAAAQQKTNDSAARYMITSALQAVERALNTPVLLATG